MARPGGGAARLHPVHDTSASCRYRMSALLVVIARLASRRGARCFLPRASRRRRRGASPSIVARVAPAQRLPPAAGRVPDVDAIAAHDVLRVQLTACAVAPPNCASSWALRSCWRRSVPTASGARRLHQHQPAGPQRGRADLVFVPRHRVDARFARRTAGRSERAKFITLSPAPSTSNCSSRKRAGVEIEQAVLRPACRSAGPARRRNAWRSAACASPGARHSVRGTSSAPAGNATLTRRSRRQRPA